MKSLDLNDLTDQLVGVVLVITHGVFKMEITAAGATIGYILQKRDNKNPIFQICDAEKTVVLEIKGPACMI